MDNETLSTQNQAPLSESLSNPSHRDSPGRRRHEPPGPDAHLARRRRRSAAIFRPANANLGPGEGRR